jgi:hypothetical protein
MAAKVLVTVCRGEAATARSRQLEDHGPAPGRAGDVAADNSVSISLATPSQLPMISVSESVTVAADWARAPGPMAAAPRPQPKFMTA